jgi:hypothetical protein
VTRKQLFVGFVVTCVFGTMASADDHAWGNYHWARSSNPVAIALGDNIDSRWDFWLAEASTDWTASSVINTSIAAGAATGNCKPADGKVEICNAKYGFNNWLGIAQIWVVGDHIIKGAVKLNDSYHDLAPYNEDGWRDLVMCQEVGHIFGLAHQDENFNNGNLGTCMDYTNYPDASPPNRQPNASDYNMLETIYGGHTDGSGGGGSGCKGPVWKCSGAQPPAPAFDMDLQGVGQWGRMISMSRDGGQSVFVQDFGAGYRVYTHTTWTMEFAARLAGR